jgi:hypothetical protein
MYRVMLVGCTRIEVKLVSVRVEVELLRVTDWLV